MQFKSELDPEGLIADYMRSSNLNPKEGSPDSTPSSTPSDIRSSPMAPSRYRTEPRVLDILPSRAIVPQDQRPTEQSKLTKLREGATEALTNSFNLIPLDDASMQIINNYNLTMRVREYSRRLQQYDMKGVFGILCFSATDSATPLPVTSDLLEQWDTLDIEVLKHHITFLYAYGQDYDLQNLTWTLELMENSCEQDLADKVQEDLLGMAPHYECGPMYFYLMMRRIISSSEDAVVAMTEKIKNMKVSAIKGEDVTVVTGQLKMAIVRLNVLSKIPEDIEKMLLSIFQTTSVVEFNSYFKQLSLSLRQIPYFRMTPS